MKILSYSETRANLASTLDAVESDREEVVITRAGHEPIVMLSLADYESMRETMYLSQGANGRMLRRSIAELRAGKAVERTLIDPDE